MDAARKFVDKGQIDKAVKEYLRIVHEDPKDVRVWLKIGDLYAKKGAKQDAIETYLKVARFYHDQGFLHKSVAVYKQIVKLDPRLVDVILKLAELYRELRMMPEAMQHFESVAAHFHREGNTKEALAAVQKLEACFKADPRDGETLGLLAQAFQALDQKAKTISVLKELARIHVENKHKELAGDVFRKILELLPTDPDAIAFLGPAAVAAARGSCGT